MPTLRRVLIIQPDFRPSGGGSLVTACIIEALKRDNVVTLLTWGSIDASGINRIFGTALDEHEFNLARPPIFVRVPFNVHPILVGFRYGILLLLAKKLGKEYDVILSVNNESDFGYRGIQYFHEPQFFLPYHPLRVVFKHRRRPWMFLGGFSYERMKRNVTMANSIWTRRKLKELYAINGTVVYPPAIGRFSSVPWDRRQNGFVCIGRIMRSKDFRKVSRIVSRVRRAVPDAHLHVVGTSEEASYRKELLHLTGKYHWMTVNENASRDHLTSLITTHRYGIHAMVNEPFGIAVAEMVRGGCIVFVPRRGGPSEIVGGDDRLLYDSADEAVDKILRVMTSRGQQLSLRRRLRSRRQLFSQGLFTRKMREAVNAFSEDASAPPRIYGNQIPEGAKDRVR